MRIYAIGDIHGQLDMLLAAHERIRQDKLSCGDTDALTVHLGDYTDRGPNSRKVIEYFLRNRADTPHWRFIKGNHDRMFTGFIGDPAHRDPILRKDIHWLDPRLGGDKTLDSYGVCNAANRSFEDLSRDAQSRVPAAHVKFLTTLPLTFETPELFFVHAGIRPGIALTDQSEDDLLWIRQGFLEDTRDFGKLVVHGHTALDAAEHYGNRVNLDSGAGYFRPLTAAVFEGRECWVLTDKGRQLLSPRS